MLDATTVQRTGISSIRKWCNPLTLQLEQSDEVGSIARKASPLEYHDKGSRTRLGLHPFCDPSTLR